MRVPTKMRRDTRRIGNNLPADPDTRTPLQKARDYSPYESREAMQRRLDKGESARVETREQLEARIARELYGRIPAGEKKPVVAQDVDVTLELLNARLNGHRIAAGERPLPAPHAPVVYVAGYGFKPASVGKPRSARVDWDAVPGPVYSGRSEGSSSRRVSWTPDEGMK